MLEHPVLLLQTSAAARARADTNRAPACTIEDPVTSQLLGVARWQRPSRRSWLSWLRWPLLLVHEAGDEPLVFTVQRCWGVARYWEICDADHHLVAVARGPWLFDRFGDCLAWTRFLADGCQLNGRDGVELAHWIRSGEELQLTFAEEVRGEPFVKMALLGAALVELLHG
jgi:hypothetical protein